VGEAFYVPNKEGAAVCYANIDVLIDACKRSGAEAVHPGYGFLSENKLFAEACLQNGIVFIGPKTSSLEDMGSKSRAKEIMEAAGVPLIKGYHGKDQTASLLHDQAKSIGFPLLIKAAMGGGGRGMLLIRSLDDFDKGLDEVKRTADELY
jgi:3-methylcrotonyl-CoA carboxylase alpha subunit